ncbi:MAG: protein TolR [Gammaproteobacteria bacterium]|nr:protein TolR [Gammaproteobacteria bacterium]MDH5650900.1 protein TolR [Gammaproteobacteria bacterium]
MPYTPSTHRFKKKRISEINVVPYIDVMLVLLVIFMVTAPLLAEGVKVDLPEISSKPMRQMEQEPLILTVDKQGLYYLNVGENPQNPIDEDTLVARVAAVKRHRNQAEVLVRGDQTVAYGRVVNAMALLQKAGVENIGLVTEPPAVTKNKRKR